MREPASATLIGPEKVSGEGLVLPASPRGSRRFGRAWAAVFLVLFLVHLPNLSSEFGGNVGGDDIIYFLLGRALATGQGYVDLYLPGHPPHTKYPFLWPLAQAPFHLLLKNPFPALHLLAILLNVSAAVLLGFWAERRAGSRGLGLLLALVFGTIPRVWSQSADLLSEPLFMFLGAAALLLSDLEPDERVEPVRFFALSLTVVGAYFTRTAGIALFGAVFLGLWRSRARVQLGRRDWPAVVPLALLFLLGVLAWALRNHVQAGETSAYLDQFLQKDPYNAEVGLAGISDLAGRMKNNSIYYFQFFLNCFDPGWRTQFSTTVRDLLTGVLLLGVAAGVVRDFRSAGLTGGALLIGLLGMILVWYFQEDRFLIPLLPLSAFFFVRGLIWPIAAWRGGTWAGRVALAAGSAILLVQVVQLRPLALDRLVDRWAPQKAVDLEGGGRWEAPVVNWARYDHLWWGQAPELMRDRTEFFIINRLAANLVPPEAVIMSRQPMYTYYLSGRESVPLFRESSLDQQWKYIRRNRVEYIVTGVEESSLDSLLSHYPGQFQVMLRVPDRPAKLIQVVDLE